MKQVPACFVAGGVITDVFYQWRPFSSADGTQHPASAWQFWTDQDWAEKVPGVSVLPVVDTRPDPATKVFSQKPVAQWTVEAERVVITYTVRDKTSEELAEELAADKKTAIAEVNRQAGEARKLYITDVPGQEGTYMAKGAEAAMYINDPSPDSANYPYLAQEAEATGMTVAQVAALVNATAAVWTTANSTIEGLRRGATVTIQAATTKAGIQAVFPISWPTP